MKPTRSDLEALIENLKAENASLRESAEVLGLIEKHKFSIMFNLSTGKWHVEGRQGSIAMSGPVANAIRSVASIRQVSPPLTQDKSSEMKMPASDFDLSDQQRILNAREPAPPERAGRGERPNCF